MLRQLDSKWIWLLSIYILGAVYWMLFLDWGNAHTFDWMLYESILTVTQTAIRTGQIPYHASFFCDESVRGSYLNNFRLLAAPWILTSPDLVALGWLRVSQWIVLHVVLLYSIGFLGIMRWIHRLNLSVAAATFAVVLFVFNGFYSAKAGVGHIGDLGGYFLIPWVFWLWANFAESEHANRRQKLMLTLEWAGLLVLIISFGALHVLQPILLGTTCIFLFHRRQLPWVGLGFGIAFSVAAYLFIPVLFYSGYAESGRLISSGFGSFTYPFTIIPQLFQSLLVPYPVIADGIEWERTAYLGWLGLALIAVAIAYPAWSGTQTPNPLRAKPFVCAMLVILVCLLASVLQVAWLLLQYVIPISALDQYPARMMIFLILYLVLLAASGFDQVFEGIGNASLRVAVKWVLLLGLFAMLVRNSWLWALPTTGTYWTGNSNNLPLFALCPQLLTMANDESYQDTVKAAYMLSLILFVALVGFYAYLRLGRTASESESISP